MIKNLIALTLFSSVFALAGQHDLEHWYHGEYKLQTKSEIAAELDLSSVIIKDIPFDDKLPMIITIFPGDKFNEINAPVYWNESEKKFTFKLDTISWCEDYDCIGLAAIEGELTGHPDKPTVVMKATFYKDVGDEAGPKGWTETLVFGDRDGDGSYSF